LVKAMVGTMKRLSWMGPETGVPPNVEKPPTRILYSVPGDALKLIWLCTPPESSLPATKLKLVEKPVKAARTVSKPDPYVFIRTRPLVGAVHPYQTLAPYR